MLIPHLEQVDVRVDHGVAEVGLDIGHGLAFDLQTVPHPHVTVDLRQAHLHKHHTKEQKRSALSLTAVTTHHITPHHRKSFVLL